MLLSWNTAAIAAACLVAFSVAAPMAARLAGRQPSGPVGVVSALAKEAGIILGIYSVWQLAGDMAVNKVDGAVRHALDIWHFERAAHLPSELAVQQLVLPHRLLVEALNAYYAIVHVPALVIFLLWLYFRHRDRYVKWRNIGAVLTLTSVLLQMVPVAPPRLMPQLGFVDTALRYHESVYGPGGISMAPQLAAMPSVHVGWAAFIAMAVIRVSRNRWRWLALLYPAMTTFVVVATANHWFLDGIVAIGLLVVAIVAEAAGARLTSRLRSRAVRRDPAGGGTLPEAEPALARR